MRVLGATSSCSTSGPQEAVEHIDRHQETVVALNETIRIMSEIDKVIAAHGGWSGAFVTSKRTERGC